MSSFSLFSDLYFEPGYENNTNTNDTLPILNKDNITSYNGHRKRVTCLAWQHTNDNNPLLASASLDGSIKLWDINQTNDSNNYINQLTKNQSGNKGQLNNVMDILAWSQRNDNLMASAGSDPVVKIWDIRTNNAIQSIYTNSAGNINIGWSDEIISRNNENEMNIDIEDDNVSNETKEDISSTSTSISSNYITVGTKDDTLIIIDVRKWKIVYKHKFNYELNEFDWLNNTTNNNSSNGVYLYLAGGQIKGSMGTIELFSFSNGTLEHINSFNSHLNSTYCLKIDPTFNYIASGGGDALINIWDINTMSCLGSINYFDFPVDRLSFSCNGSYISGSGGDHHITIARTMTGQGYCKINTNCSVTDLVWHPKINNILAYAPDKKVNNSKGRKNNTNSNDYLNIARID